MANRPLWGTTQNIPWREWNIFGGRTFRQLVTQHSIVALTYAAANVEAKWTDEHTTFSFAGRDRVAGAYDGFYPFFKPMAADFIDHAQLQTIHTVGFRFTLGFQESVGGPFTAINLNFSFLTESQPIDWNKITGKHYDGVNNFDNYPPIDYTEGGLIAVPGADFADPLFADMPRDYHSYIQSITAGGFVLFNRFSGTDHAIYQDDMFRNGFKLESAGTTPAVAINERLYATMVPQSVRLYYLHACVNSLSRRAMQAAGGVELTLTGLGFRIPEAELQAYDFNPGAYNHVTAHVHFIGREGQGTYTLDWNLGLPARDFNLSNTTLTVRNMPAMAAGTYFIQLCNCDDERGAVNLYSTYAGDWRTDAQGRIRPGERLVFVVYDEKIPVDPPQPFFEWGWKWGDLELKEHYAPLDTRATATFWDGRVLGLSSLTRSIDDRTGLFNISDVNVELANQDKHFSKLLANYFCKGQIASIAHGRGSEPEAWHETVFFAMVDDYNLRGPGFDAKLKDYAQKYLKGQQPRYIVTREEYPDCKDAAVGAGIQELVGRHYFAAGSAPGAIQAHCTDENLFIYICARGPLHAILNVYADGTAVNPANYVAFIDAAGRQYIQFNGDQEDKKITFNCEGYMFGLWDSANGYIQNPAYVIAFYWAMLLEIPINFIDMDAVDAMATAFDDAGLGEIGKLHIVSLEEKGAILQKLLFSFGVKYWQTKEGLLTIGRKDIASLATSIFIHAQIEVQDIPDRAYNLESAVNLVKAYYNHFPAADLYEGSIEESDPASIAQFGSEMSPSEPWKYPFITSEDYCEQRVLEDLLKFAYGDKYVKFNLPLEMIGDIDIFDNFQLQDPYGLSATGDGEIGRYYYITSLTYDYQNSTIGVVAIDLQWLLQQYFIFGDENAMPDLWEDASEYFRYYGYLCDETTGEFSDGFRGKILIDENLLEQE